MSPLNRTFRVSVVNGIGRILNGATVTVYRDGVPKVNGDIKGGPLDFQITGPGKIECEATYNGIHKKVEVQPSDNHIRIKITRWMTMPKLAIAAVCLGILSILLLLNKGAVVFSPPEVRAEYVGSGTHTKPVVVVFVHGIFGDKRTWQSQKTSFPELLTSDPEFEKNVDAFLFEYFSPRFGPGSNVNELAKQLKAALEDKGVLRDHAHVVFLCHSMGGLVTRRALLLIRDLRKVPMIYFYATPTNGARITEFASKISSSPQLKSMLPLEGNEALEQVQDDWINWPETRTLPSYCAYETLPIDGVFVVDESSARALCNRLPEGMTANHITIVKPPSREDPRYTRFATALRETVTDSLTGGRLVAGGVPPPIVDGGYPVGTTFERTYTKNDGTLKCSLETVKTSPTEWWERPTPTDPTDCLSDAANFRYTERKTDDPQYILLYNESRGLLAHIAKVEVGQSGPSAWRLISKETWNEGSFLTRTK